MKNALAILTVLWISSFVVAGNVTYIVPTEEQVVEPVILRSSEFDKPADGAGTISRSAMVATVKATGEGQELDPATMDAMTARRMLLKAAMSSIQVAVDSSKADSKAPDVVRFDFSGQGKFDKDLAVPLKADQGGWTFGPKTLQVKRGGKTLPVSVQGRYVKVDATDEVTLREIQVTVLAGVQGDVKFGDKTHAVRLVDANGNFNFNDAARPMEKGGQVVAITPGDTIAIDTGDGKFGPSTQLFPYGQPVRVDGKWYKVSLVKGTISAQSVNLPPATVKVNAPEWACKLASQSGVLYLRGAKEPVEVPAGDYFILDYDVLGTAGNSPAGAPRPMFSGRGQSVVAGEVKPVSLAAGKEALLPIGAPLKAGVTSKQSEGDVVFSFALADCGGHVVGGVIGNKGTPPPPKISVVDASGKEVYQNTLEYG